MTARKSWFVFCDDCGEGDGLDAGYETAQEMRDELSREFGWRVNLPGGRDLCENCRTTVNASRKPTTHPQ